MSSGATEHDRHGPRLRALVIGYGSPIRGDDAIGPLAADRLDADTLPEDVRVISRHILTADLVPDIVDAARVIFVDAAAGGEPGSIRCCDLQADARAISSMAHFLDPRELLAWAQGLYGHCPVAHLVTIAGAEFDYGYFDLSDAVDRVLPDLLERIASLIDAPLPQQARQPSGAALGG